MRIFLHRIHDEKSNGLPAHATLTARLMANRLGAHGHGSPRMNADDSIDEKYTILRPDAVESVIFKPA